MTATRSAAFLAGTFNLAHGLGQKLDASDCQELIDALVKAKAEIELTSKLPDMQELLAKHPCKRGPRTLSPIDYQATGRPR